MVSFRFSTNMKLSDESYSRILITVIIIFVSTILILLAFKYRDQLLKLCKSPDTIQITVKTKPNVKIVEMLEFNVISDTNVTN